MKPCPVTPRNPRFCFVVFSFFFFFFFVKKRQQKIYCAMTRGYVEYKATRRPEQRPNVRAGDCSLSPHGGAGPTLTQVEEEEKQFLVFHQAGPTPLKVVVCVL